MLLAGDVANADVVHVQVCTLRWWAPVYIFVDTLSTGCAHVLMYAQFLIGLAFVTS